MQRACAVLECRAPAPVLHPFPASEPLRSRWVGATGRGRSWIVPGGGGGVCARHFAPDHYTEGELRDDAVPALHLPPRGLDAELAALTAGMTTSRLLRLAEPVARRPVLLLQPPPPRPHPEHAAHQAALAELARDLRLRDLDRVQSILNLYIQVYDRVMRWCSVRAQYELGARERALELAPKWVRRAEELRAGGAGDRGAAGAAWRGLAERARAARCLHPPPPLESAVGVLWARGLQLARRRLELLARVGDDVEALHPGARPSFHLEDIVLLYDDEAGAAVVGAGATGAASELALLLLFGLVQKYRLEDVGGGGSGGAAGWAAAAREYRARHRAASPLLLQRRWHGLKAAARLAPAHPLHAALLRRFPHVRGAPPPPWCVLRAAGLVTEEDAPAPYHVVAESLEDVAMRFQEPSEDDDVILVERHIDTYEISDEEDSLPRTDPSDDHSNDKSEDKSSDAGDASPHQLCNGASEREDIAGAGVGVDVDRKLMMSAAVVVSDMRRWAGWRVREGRYVRLQDLHPPPPPPSPPPPRRSLAHTIVYEDDDDDDSQLVISFSEEAVCEETLSPVPSVPPVPSFPPVPSVPPEPRKRVHLPDIEQIRAQNRTMLTAEVTPLAGGGAAGRYCCVALRARALHAARARTAERAGRLYCPIDDAVQFHRSHCSEPCQCCCRGAERGLAGAELAAEQAELDAHLLRLLPSSPATSPPSSVPPPALLAPAPPPAAYGVKRPARAGPRSKKRRPASPQSPPAADGLQEWIRQKNLNARFFNLKRPAPTATRAPAPCPTPIFRIANPRARPLAPLPVPAVPVVSTPSLVLPRSLLRMAPPPLLSPPPPPPHSVAAATVSEQERAECESRAGMRIVTIRRNRTSGQRVIVVRPATGSRGDERPPPPPVPAAPPLRRLIVLARKLTETEIQTRRVIEPVAVTANCRENRPPTDRDPDVTGKRDPDVTGKRDPDVSGKRDPDVTSDRDPDVADDRHPDVIGKRDPDATRNCNPDGPGERDPDVTDKPPDNNLVATNVTEELSDRYEVVIDVIEESDDRKAVLTDVCDSVVINEESNDHDSVVSDICDLVGDCETTTVRSRDTPDDEMTPTTAVTAIVTPTVTATMTAIDNSITENLLDERNKEKTATGSESDSEHSDESYNHGYIQYISSTQHAGGMLTVAPVAAPVTVTVAPLTITVAPLTATAAPLTTTAAPLTATAAPLAVTAAPLTVSATPSTVTAAPSTVTSVPLTVTSVPVTLTAGDCYRAPQESKPLVFQALPSAVEDIMFKDMVVESRQVSWAGRPLVMACSRLQAPWAPLLGWYMLTEAAGTPGPGPDLDYWVFGETMYRLASAPPGDVRLVRGVRDARSCRALVVRGAPLLALHVGSRRVLRVAARRHADRLWLRAAATCLAERLAEALNAVSVDDPLEEDAVIEILDEHDPDRDRDRRTRTL